MARKKIPDEIVSSITFLDSFKEGPLNKGSIGMLKSTY